MFRKVLIANRGEIAVRIARACRDLGVRTVAVVSEPDQGSLHARLADEVELIGPAPSSESYLCMDRILDAARRRGAEAIHPGYGFLSENGAFARAVADAGLVFIGPPEAALSLMGDKARAREAAKGAGVPIVPGTEPLTSVEDALVEAERIGFPIVVKATAGGGGKGMRRVANGEALAAAFGQARSEAASSFGDDSVYIEKYVERPRHIEIQVAADSRGHVVHLFERECSIQRRHQKLIEESPSPFLDPGLREDMGSAAVAIAREAGYENVGTVEFLVDAEKNFYFLEMNARLQVEHPVTEVVTGVDLVELQLRVASGEALGLSQDDLVQRGWAMELRITAEDPFENFTPSAGRIDLLRPPEGPGIRHDGGIDAGMAVTPHYDPLIAKLIVSANSRARCLARARRAVSEYRIRGVRTTLPFFARMLRDERFIAGEMDVGFVDRHWMKEMASPPPRTDGAFVAAMAAVAAAAHSGTRAESRDSGGRARSLWRERGRLEQMGSRL